STNVETKLVSERFFETWGIPLMRGRDFEARDGGIQDIATNNVERKAIVNEAFAKKFLPGREPLDQTFGMCPEQTGARIVGVVPNVRSIHMRLSDHPTMYLFQPASQSAAVAVRTRGNPKGLIPPIRKLMTEIDPSLPLAQFSTELEIRDSVIQEQPLSTL